MTLAPKKSEIVCVTTTALPCPSMTASDVVLPLSRLGASPAFTPGVMAPARMPAARAFA